RRRKEIVTKPQIQSQPLIDPPVILRKEPVLVAYSGGRVNPGAGGCSEVGFADKKICNFIAGLAERHLRTRRGSQIREEVKALSEVLIDCVDMALDDGGAELERVLTPNVAQRV